MEGYGDEDTEGVVGEVASAWETNMRTLVWAFAVSGVYVRSPHIYREWRD